MKKGNQMSGEPVPAADSAIRRVTLPERMDLTAAAPLAGAIAAAEGQPVELEAAGVRHLGGLCLQVLLATGQQWQRSGVALRVSGASEEFTNALRQFGVCARQIENGEPG